MHCSAVACFRRKQHFGRKYKVVFLRAMYGTPLDELDIFGHWAADVKEQHYAQLAAPTSVANTLGARNEMQYFLPHGDLDPSSMPEFKAMVNAPLPWLGRKAARAEEVGCKMLYGMH
jgi:hypothetical protein